MDKMSKEMMNFSRKMETWKQELEKCIISEMKMNLIAHRYHRGKKQWTQNRSIESIQTEERIL